MLIKQSPVPSQGSTPLRWLSPSAQQTGVDDCVYSILLVCGDVGGGEACVFAPPAPQKEFD